MVINGGIRTRRVIGQRASPRDLESSLKEILILPYRKLAVDLGMVEPERGLIGRVVELYDSALVSKHPLTEQVPVAWDFFLHLYWDHH